MEFEPLEGRLMMASYLDWPRCFDGSPSASEEPCGQIAKDIAAAGESLVVSGLDTALVSKPVAGDTNLDGRFDQLDLAALLRAAKYLTGETAAWNEGDWTADGVFDQEDIVAALQTGNAFFAGFNVRYGVPVPDNNSYVGFLSSDTNYCSSLLIAPNVGLTAAHCVVQRVSKEHPQGILRDGLTFSIDASQEASTPIVEVRPHPNYLDTFWYGELGLMRGGRAMGADLALFRTEVPIMDVDQPSFLKDQTTVLGFNPPADWTIVGFGRDENDQARVRKAGQFRNALGSGTLELVGLSSAGDAEIREEVNGGFALYMTTEKQIGCRGDSGAPVFVNGQVAAVLSAVARHGTSCEAVFINYATSIVPYLDWIEAGRDAMQVQFTRSDETECTHENSFEEIASNADTNTCVEDTSVNRSGTIDSQIQVVGDSNLDGRFDRWDIVQVLQAHKYSTARAANWSEGDWNNDGLFDQADIVTALRADHYSN